MAIRETRTGIIFFLIKKHILKEKLNISDMVVIKSVRDVLHIAEFTELNLKHIHKFTKINNITLNVGWKPKNKISLLELTKLCEKITKNICKKAIQKNTSNYDIPYYVTDNKQVYRIYNWIPKKNINTLLKDLYNWMINNKNLIKKF